MLNRLRHAVQWGWVAWRVVIILITIGGLLGFVLLLTIGYRDQLSGRVTLLGEFYSNIITELVFFIITVFVIDRLYQRRETKRQKEQLRRELGSYDNGIATRAASELSGHGWLSDGSLNEAMLFRANLEDAFLHVAKLQRAELFAANLRRSFLNDADLTGADLSTALLQKADLSGAILIGTKLNSANLEEAVLWDALLIDADLSRANITRARMGDTILLGAIVSEEQLAQTGWLRRSILPNMSRYDGRYNLEGDLAAIPLMDADTSDAEVMASFYEVPVEAYLEGQEWANNNLERVREAGKKLLEEWPSETSEEDGPMAIMSLHPREWGFDFSDPPLWQREFAEQNILSRLWAKLWRRHSFLDYQSSPTTFTTPSREERGADPES